jgi:hypothetical protein
MSRTAFPLSWGEWQGGVKAAYAEAERLERKSGAAGLTDEEAALREPSRPSEAPDSPWLDVFSESGFRVDFFGGVDSGAPGASWPNSFFRSATYLLSSNRPRNTSAEKPRWLRAFVRPSVIAPTHEERHEGRPAEWERTPAGYWLFRGEPPADVVVWKREPVPIPYGTE